MINMMLQNKSPIIYGDGEQTRCFSYIDDCLSCLIPMLDQKNLHKETINIGPDQTSVNVPVVTEDVIYIGRVQMNLNDGKKRKFLYFQSDYILKP